jgi:hypothetical protein
MSTPEKLMAWLLTQPADAVAALDDYELIGVSGELGRIYDENGPTGTLLGICLVEQARRFVEGKKDGRGLEVPATPNDGEGFL